MNQIKQNLPVILLLSIVPYFFYSDPSLPQAIIAAVLGAVAAYKYHLEKSEINYVKMFEKKMLADQAEIRAAYLKDFDKLAGELEAIRNQKNTQSIQNNIEKKINMAGW